MFIEKSDLTRNIHLEYLDEITRGDDLIVNASIDAAIIEIKGYLIARYDVTSIFSQTGTNRNALLVEFASDIAIYNLVDIDRPGINIEDRRARYKRAIDWLKQVNSGDISTDLPLLPELAANISTERISIASNIKRNSHY